MRSTIRSAAIVLEKNCVLLMKRKKYGKLYYTFPGGAFEEGEDLAQTAARETREETSVVVSPVRLLYHQRYPEEHIGTTEQLFWLCNYVSGVPGLPIDSIEYKYFDKDTNYYEPQWIPIETLPALLLYPLPIRDWLIEDLRSGLSTEPRVADVAIEELRQTL